MLDEKILWNGTMNYYFEKGYNKAIDDMISIITEMRDTATAMMWAESESACDRFIVQAEQLKDGGEND